MKKFFLLGAVFFGLLVAQNGYADSSDTMTNKAPAPEQATSVTTTQSATTVDTQNVRDARYNRSGDNYQGNYRDGEQSVVYDGSCPQDHPCEDQACGDCWCKYCHYEPCYYTTKRCVEERIPCKKKCCRNVPKYYEVQRCKYVPQYYNETVCCQEPEYYYVEDCKICKKTVCDTHCKYVPKYYWKHVCGQPNCSTPCPR